MGDEIHIAVKIDKELNNTRIILDQSVDDEFTRDYFYTTIRKEDFSNVQ